MIETILLGIFIVPVSLILLVGFHEYGHFLFAKIVKVNVIRFSIGFGKPLWLKKSRAGTEYAFCVLPLGGYVKLTDTIEKEPIYKRILIIIGGPLFSLLLGFIAYWLVFLIGITQPLPIIGNIEPDSLAFKSGMMAHTQIMAVDHHSTQTWAAVALRLIPHLGMSDEIQFTTKDPNGKVSLHSVAINQWMLNDLRPDLLSSLGIKPESHATKVQKRQYSFYPAISVAFHECLLYFQVNGLILWKMIQGIISVKSLVGPIGLFAATITAANLGFVIYLTFIGFISVSLAFINLLPIPGLDGSYLVYLLYEMLFRKPVSIQLQMLLFRLGFIVLVILMIQALMNDLLRLTYI